MQKDEFIKKFDEWAQLKKKIEESHTARFAKKRDIWWCSFGVNIGTELCGKNALHERPVLVLKAYNAYTVKVLPLTTNPSSKKYTTPIVRDEGGVAYGVLSQVKTISTKRLTRKIGKLDPKLFATVLDAYITSCR